MKKGIFPLLAAVLCLWGALEAAPAQAKAAKPADLMSGVRPAVPSSACALPDETARRAVNRFSAELFRASGKNPGNVMVSPASVYLALGIFGVLGPTANAAHFSGFATGGLLGWLAAWRRQGV